jgi:hypothetical protein
MKRRSTHEPKTKRRCYGGGYPPFKRARQSDEKKAGGAWGE